MGPVVNDEVVKVSVVVEEDSVGERTDDDDDNIDEEKGAVTSDGDAVAEEDEIDVKVVEKASKFEFRLEQARSLA